MFFSCFGLNKKRKKQQAECDNSIFFLESEILKRELGGGSKFIEIDRLEEETTKQHSSQYKCIPDHVSLQSIAAVAQKNPLLASEILSNSQYFTLFDSMDLYQILDNKNYHVLATQLIASADCFTFIKNKYSLAAIATIGRIQPQFFLKFIDQFNEDTIKETCWYLTILNKYQFVYQSGNNYQELEPFYHLLNNNKLIFSRIQAQHPYLLSLLITDKIYGKSYLKKLNKKHPQITEWWDDFSKQKIRMGETPLNSAKKSAGLQTATVPTNSQAAKETTPLLIW